MENGDAERGCFWVATASWLQTHQPGGCMSKFIGTTICAAMAASATIAIGAQSTSPAQTSTGTSSANEQKVVVTGCLKEAPSSSASASTAGTAGTAGSTAGSTATGTAGTPGTTGTTSEPAGSGGS